jgi:hypothetical protein
VLSPWVEGGDRQDGEDGGEDHVGVLVYEGEEALLALLAGDAFVHGQ